MTERAHGQASASSDEISLLTLYALLRARRKFIVKVTACVTALALVISFLLPKIYTGTVRLMPPQQNQSPLLASLGSLSMLAGGAASALGLKNPNDLYVGMLQSRTISDNLIAQFKLDEVYDSDYPEDTRKVLAENSNIVAGKDGLILIEVDDKLPERAAGLANAYATELYKIMTTLAVTEASQRRLFFERQIIKTQESLAAAEVAFKNMQQQTGLLMLSEQGKVMVEGLAQLRATLAGKEVEQASMNSFATRDNPDAKRLATEIAGLKDQILRLEQRNISAGSEDNILFAAGKIPELGLEYVRRLREVKYQEAVFEQLSKQLELARIDEAHDFAMIQILDKAVTPQKKSRPKRALITILAAFLSLSGSSAWVLFRAGTKDLKKLNTI